MYHSDRVAYTKNAAKAAAGKALAFFDGQGVLSWHNFHVIPSTDTNWYTFTLPI
ncbi:hypothetical protein [Methyloglobulus sp.]|uniref:hypothetical protein n=1 Tax=Methyloglobulus sp. TaxID=2518622 RepID=UPI003988EE1E